MSKLIEAFHLMTAFSIMPQGVFNVKAHSTITVGLHYIEIWLDTHDDLDSLSYPLVHFLDIRATQRQDS